MQLYKMYLKNVLISISLSFYWFIKEYPKELEILVYIKDIVLNVKKPIKYLLTLHILMKKIDIFI